MRVPLADVNLLKLPARVPEDAGLLLSDILPTGWHGCELAGVGRGDKVAVWGAGPVGILAAHCAFARGADRVVLIDGNAERLKFAAERIDRLETLNKDEKKVLPALHEELFPESKGPDWCAERRGSCFDRPAFIRRPGSPNTPVPTHRSPNRPPLIQLHRGGRLLARRGGPRRRGADEARPRDRPLWRHQRDRLQLPCEPAANLLHIEYLTFSSDASSSDAPPARPTTPPQAPAGASASWASTRAT